jgi:hypothetical protein
LNHDLPPFAGNWREAGKSVTGKIWKVVQWLSRMLAASTSPWEAEQVLAAWQFGNCESWTQNEPMLGFANIQVQSAPIWSSRTRIMRSIKQ